MRCTRLFWLTGACALSLLLMISPLGCQSEPAPKSPTTPGDEGTGGGGEKPEAKSETEPAAKTPAAADIITPKPPLGLQRAGGRSPPTRVAFWHGPCGSCSRRHGPNSCRARSGER